MTDEKDKPEVKEIDCLEAIGHLYAYLDGELKNETELAQFEQHLDHCRSCYSRAQMEKALNQRLQSMGEAEPPKSLQNRLKNLIEKL